MAPSNNDGKPSDSSGKIPAVGKLSHRLAMFIHMFRVVGSSSFVEPLIGQR